MVLEFNEHDVQDKMVMENTRIPIDNVIDYQ
jgi:hypothetical protein